MQRLLDMLQQASDYVGTVVEGKLPADSHLGRKVYWHCRKSDLILECTLVEAKKTICGPVSAINGNLRLKSSDYKIFREDHRAASVGISLIVGLT